jgi:tetratricopeptide (TPR) repeat protein
VSLICLAVIGVVLWVEGRSFAACFAHGRSNAIRSEYPAAALVDARRAIELAPHNAQYRASAGDLAVALQRFDAAVQYYQSAVDCDPYRASYHWRLAKVLRVAGGTKEKIIEQLRRAQMLNPTKELYRHDLEEMLRQPTADLLGSPPVK